MQRKPLEPSSRLCDAGVIVPHLILEMKGQKPMEDTMAE